MIAPVELPMPMPLGDLDDSIMECEYFYCRGPCAGPLMCAHGLVCNRCGFDNTIDRQVRPATKNLQQQHKKYMRVTSVFDAINGDSDAEDDDEDRAEAEDEDFDEEDDDSDSDSDVDSVVGEQEERGSLAEPSPRATSKANGKKAKKPKKARSENLVGSIRKRSEPKADRKAQMKHKTDENKGRAAGSAADKVPYGTVAKSVKKVTDLVKKNSDLGDPDEISAKKVKAHCTVLLLKLGYRFGDYDGPAHKYAVVVERMMKLPGGFNIKSQFKLENETMATLLAKRLATADKANGGNPGSSHEKLAKNFMAAFKCYCEALLAEEAGTIDLTP